MRFWKGDFETVKIRWYRALPSAVVVEGWSRFRSFSTWERGQPIPDIGEQFHARGTKYDRGVNFGGWLGNHYEGSEKAWRYGGVHGETPGIATDALGGTPGCPFGGQPGPVVIAQAPHGAGQVVCFGGPSLLRYDSGDGSPIPDWNTPLLTRIRQWQVEVGRNQPIGTPGPKSDWLMAAAQPTKENFGWEEIDYDDTDIRYALMQRLKTIGMMWVGWNNLDYQNDHQFFNDLVVEIIHQWVIDGGILLIVNNVVKYDDTDPHPLNILLQKINVQMQFVHGDVVNDPFVKVIVNPLFSSNEGSCTLVPLWVNANLGIQPVAAGGAHVTMSLFSGVCNLRCFFRNSHYPPGNAWGYSFEFYFWVTGTGLPHTVSGYVYWGSGFFTWSYHGPFSGTPTKITIAVPTGDVPLSGPMGGICEVNIIPASFGVTPTCFVAGVKLTVTVCAGTNCKDPVCLNPLSPVVAEDGVLQLTHVDCATSSTVSGGLWVAALCGYPPPPTPQGQAFLQHITGHGVGHFEPLHNPIGSGTGALHDLVAAGDGVFNPPPIGSGTGALHDLVAAGDGTFAPPVFTGSGTGALHDLVAAGSGTYESSSTGSGAAGLHDLVASGSGSYLSLSTGAGMGVVVELVAGGTGTFAAAPGFDVITTTGTWLCPSGVTTVDVLIEPRGGNGGPNDGMGTTTGGGGGGCASAFTNSLSVTPGTNYNVTLGTGSGSSSDFDGRVIAVAGNDGGTPTGGAGGLASACTGTVTWSGGNGADGGATDGGGGGGAAGLTGDGGTPGPGSGPGGGNSPGGGGGTGGILFPSSPATPGDTPGGGGGGADYSNSPASGGTGYVKISWPGT